MELVLKRTGCQIINLTEQYEITAKAIHKYNLSVPTFQLGALAFLRGINMYLYSVNPALYVFSLHVFVACLQFRMSADMYETYI